jgi:hypothetical protein
MNQINYLEVLEDQTYKDIQSQLWNVERVLNDYERYDINLDGLNEFRNQLKDKLNKRLEILSK